MTQIVYRCRDCGSYDVEWRKDTHTLRYIHCRQCGAQLRGDFSASTSIMLLLALAAAVWVWATVFEWLPRS
jgi:DNA-directed RNA polymerase subunit RPC12/RpoP